MAELVKPPRVKICGLTRPEDVLQALSVGADAVGFVFHPTSPRYADPRDVAAIVSLLPVGTLTVAVVVDATPREARALLDTTGIRGLQLCGAQVAKEWEHFDAPILRRLAVTSGAQEELERWCGVASAFLLDHPSSAGGSGQEVDHDLAALICNEHPCLLAGGLDACRVARAIHQVRPDGVDASSRLELTTGVKDHQAVRDFVVTALDTYAELES